MSGKQVYDRKVIVAEICEWLSQGKTMTAFCQRDDSPSLRLVYDWMAEDEDIAARIARARDTGHDVMADDCVRIADEVPPCDDNGKTDSGYVAWQKNRIWTRTQLLAKWNPKKYGDKVDVSHKGQIGLSINIDLSDDDKG